MLDYCQEKQQTLSLMADKWQQVILNTNLTPARTVIKVFSDIAYNFRDQPKHLATTCNIENFTYKTRLITLAKKTNCSTSTINRCLARLEKMGYIKRHLKHILTSHNIWLFNVLFVELTELGYQLCNLIPNFFKISPPQICRDKVKEKNNNIDLVRSDILKNNKDIDLTDDNSQNIQKSIQRLKIITFPKPEIQNRTDKVKTNSYKDDNAKSNINQQNSHLLREEKNLLQCLPITEEEAQYLRNITKRSFSTLFINELGRHLSIKNPNFTCWYRKGFLDYMLSSIINEKRSVEEVNAGRYEFDHMREQNKIFTEIENSTKTTINALIKKRILSYFTADKALNILKNCYFSKEVTMNNYLAKRNYNIYYQTNFELNYDEKAAIIKIVQEYSNYTDNTTGKIKFAETQFLPQKYQQFVKNNVESITTNIINNDLVHNQQQLKLASSQHQEEFISKNIIWQKVREILSIRYGNAVDRSWFSKIGFNYNQVTETVELYYDSIFRQRKADVDYGFSMYAAIRTELPYLKKIRSKVNNSNYVEDVWW